MEARAQLQVYRDWFEVAHNRERLKSQVGMEVYRPRLMVVIGRSSAFHDDFDRQQLRNRNTDIEVVTYDDLLDYAYQRRVFLGIEH